MDHIEKTIAVINQMTKDGVIESYALGGATAVIFYTEPIATQDIDIFIHVQARTSVLMEFQPVFDYLKEKGYNFNGEHVYIEGFPVQFLPIPNSLIREAVDEANEFEFQDKTIVRVISPEFLVAIMLETGRLKDYLRISVFIQHDVIDQVELERILVKYNLLSRWKENIHKFQP